MCGGSDANAQTAPATTTNYTAPDLKAQYAQFRDTGKVPYSYYGAGAPTNADELARVRAAYPGSFSTPAQNPANSPNGSPSVFSRLIQALMHRQPPEGAPSGLNRVFGFGANNGKPPA